MKLLRKITFLVLDTLDLQRNVLLDNSILNSFTALVIVLDLIRVASLATPSGKIKVMQSRLLTDSQRWILLVPTSMMENC